ncbi:carbonic anhydrase 2-like [Planococcus citri]|uniref:carbonic anhydrase 2-like n=1 Tax=Planococcus citri TaxID=170843 RepID=UPI0031F77E49
MHCQSQNDFLQMMRFLLLIFIANFLSIQLRLGSAGKSELFVNRYHIPSKTQGPLNINTSKVKNIALSPFRVTALLGESTKVMNTGNAIEVVNTEKNSGTTVTGGPLQNDIYEFHLTRFYWSSNTSGPVATLVDGADGVPIEAVHYWFNRKYGSFENSKNYRDGMVAFSFPVKVGPVPSLTFLPFSRKLKQVRESNSSVSAYLFEHFVWFDGYLLPNTPYFSYPSSYTDYKTSKKYYCTTAVIFRPKPNFISITQFCEYFLTLKNSKGGRLTNAVRSHPQGDIPVIQAEGQTQIFIPYGKRLLDLSQL